jgi:Uma2 family endonuclease
MAAEPQRLMTPDEYLAFERHSTVKHQYIDGRLVAMAGASADHNTIQFNLSAALRPQLRGRGCYGFGSDMRVSIGALGIYTYPDLTVVCGERELGPGSPDILLNPTLIIEILSPSTERDDRGRKFGWYRRIPSLREYVLVAQDKPMIEHYVRQASRPWWWDAVEGLQETIELPSIGCSLVLAEVYEDVEFSPEEM